MTRCLLPIALLLTSLGCNDVVLHAEPGDPSGDPVPRIRVLCGSVDPHRLTFPPVAVQTTATASLILESAGTAPLTVSELAVSGSGFELWAPTELPRLLEPGEQLPVDLVHSPELGGAMTGLLEIVSDDPVDPWVPVQLSGEALSPAVSVEPTSWDFGEVPIGATEMLDLHLRNDGEVELAVTGLSHEASSDELQLTSEVEPPFTLDPGDQRTLRIRYQPADAHPDSGALLVSSTDPARPLVTAAQQGTGLTEGHALVIEPAGHDFGQLAIDCEATAGFLVRNAGQVALTLTGAGHDTSSGDLVAAGLASAEGELLEPGASLPLEVTYLPSDVDFDEGTLWVTSDLPQASRAEALVAGDGFVGQRTFETFVQDAVEALDILFVVDNSGSMGDEQAALSTNIDLFVDIVVASGDDFRLATITTDVGDSGAFQGADPVVTPLTPDPEGTFAANVQTGTDGSDFEQAFQSAYLALSNTNNPPFLRPQAALALVFVSDEPEQSSQLGTVYDYVAWFQAQKADPSLLSMSDISGGLSGCSGVGGSASAGVDFVTATDETGGVSGSICAPDWATTMEDLATEALSLTGAFVLAEPAVAPSVRVSVDGAQATTGWSFDSDANAVVFAPEATPEQGATIDVSYITEADCTP